jgi:GntR family transcriptional regulator, rspAB operon transcriptional repressor
MPAARNRVVSRDGQNVANIHARMREAILSGDMAAGEVTTQVALGESLGAGRTPIREALRLLQREGLVIAEPNRRVRVADLSADDAESLYVGRIALEVVALRITVPALQSPDFAELEGLMAQMEHYMGERDWRGLRAPHRAFHTKLGSAAGERVVELVGQGFDHAERYRLAQSTLNAREWDLRAEEHRGLVEAAKAGDADLAARRLAEHYGHTAQLVLAALDPGNELHRLRTTLASVAPGSESVLR